MPTPRSTLDTILRRERWHVRGTGWIGDAIYGVNDGLGAVFGIVSGMAGYTGGSEVVLAAGLAGTLASALSMGAGAYLASKSEREVYESEVARERTEIEEDPHEELLELELFYQLKGFSAEEARSMAERLQKEPKQFLRTLVHEELGLSEETFPNPWRSTLSATVSTAIGGFIPIIPFFFTVGMPAVDRVVHHQHARPLRRRRLEGARHDAIVVGQRRRDDDRRHPRGGDHLRPRPRVRRPLMSRPPAVFLGGHTAIGRSAKLCIHGITCTAVRWHFLCRFPGQQADAEVHMMLKTHRCVRRGAAADGERRVAGAERHGRSEGLSGLQGRRDERRPLHAVHDLRRHEREREGRRRDADRQGDDAVQARRHREARREGRRRPRACAIEITVLPVSQFDDELRYRIARSIYGNSNFWNYAIMANPPIHIVVEHGRVTLTGVVQSNVDRMLARSLATQFGALSVTNELKTDAEVRDALEKSE